MNAALQNLDLVSKTFVGLLWPMIIQSSLIIGGLVIAEKVLRRRLCPVLRYWMWLLVLAALVLPVSPLARGLWQYWPGIKTAQADIFTLQETAISAAQPELQSPAADQLSMSWQAVVFLVWLAAVLAITAWLVYRIIAVRKLIATARDANGFMQDTLRYCCKCLGVNRKIGFKVSVNVTRPIVWGFFHPVIIIPHDLAPSLGARHLRAVLFHEIAHIKRGDLWVNLCQMVLQILYFFNPLLWFANWMIRRLREQAANQTVLDTMGSQSPWYSETLADVTSMKFKPPVLGIAFVAVEESMGLLPDWINPKAGHLPRKKLRLSA